jgi:enterochelin esterase-like enzyme
MAPFPPGAGGFTGAGPLASRPSGGTVRAVPAQREPETFRGVAAFSAGVVPGRPRRGARAAGVRHYLAAGALEGGFRGQTERWAQRLSRAGLPCSYREWPGGHDSYWWEQEFPAALAWLLS